MNNREIRQMADQNGWDQYQKLVLHELSQNTEAISRLENKMAKIEVRLVKSETKQGIISSLFGVIGGVLAAIGVSLARK